MRIEFPENDLRFDRTLYVREVQTYLRQIAFVDERVPLIAVDGIFGSETTKAVKAVQKCARLTETGRVDFETFSAIIEHARAVRTYSKAPLACAPFTRLTSPVCAGECGAVVPFAKAMFNGLCERFSNFEPEPVNDEMTAVTRRNVKEIQRVCEQTPTGVLDTASWNGLARAFNNCATERYIVDEV